MEAGLMTDHTLHIYESCINAHVKYHNGQITMDLSDNRKLGLSELRLPRRSNPEIPKVYCNLFVFFIFQSQT